MRRPPVIYRPDPLPVLPAMPKPEPVAVMFGRMHRGYRLSVSGRSGYTLDCSGRWVRSDRVTVMPLAELDRDRWPNVMCKFCFGERS